MQENNFQLSRVVNFSKATECCQGKVQSGFNGQLGKLKKEGKVSLGSCWEIGSLSNMKRPSWTSRTLSENASSILCSTVFTGDFFVPFDGRYLSNSSIGEVFEVNVKFVATWLKQWRRNNGENMYQVLLITLYQIWNVQKGKTNHERSCQSFPFISKTDYLHLKTGYKDESPSLWKQLKWNKFPFFGDGLCGKIIRGINIADSVLRKSIERNKVPWWGDSLSRELTLNKWLKNKIVLKLAPSTQKSKQLPYMEIVVASTNTGKVVHIKQVWTVWNRIKAATCYSETSFFKYRSQQQQLVSSSYERTQPLVKFLINTCLRSEFSAQICRNWITFPFSRSDVQLQ